MSKKSFDGSNKGSAGKGQSIKYHEQSTSFMNKIKNEVIANASPEALQYLDPLNYKGPKIIIDAAELDPEQWIEMRQNSIGSSAASQVFGASPYDGCTNLDLFYNKIGVKEVIQASRDERERRERMFDYGHRMEGYLQLVTKQLYPLSNLIIDTNVYASEKRPYMTANLDAMMQLSDGSYVHVEYKTASEFGQDSYANNSIPMHYKHQLIQCQHIMGVWVSYLIVAFSRDDIIVRRYVRDLDAEMDHVMEVENFWENHVLAGIPPAKILGPSDVAVNTIRRYAGYAQNNTVPLQLDKSLVDDVKEINELSKEIADLDARRRKLVKLKDAHIVPIAEALGKNVNAVIDGYEISWTANKGRSKVNIDRLREFYPDAFSDCVTEGAQEVSRTMKVKEVK